MCSGNAGNAFGARQNVLQGNGTRVQGIRGLWKPERNLQREHGARQEETLRGSKVDNSSGRCYEGAGRDSN